MSKIKECWPTVAPRQHRDGYQAWSTMAFEAIQEGIYLDADICKPFAFDGLQALPKGSNDLDANNMHENAVDAIVKQLAHLR